ncbi:MAG: tRNA uridine-5-carboxymethylaminomethyl(34) synthesis GTPase MnmE [Deltaproteobacteria bacterium]|jgi:tRNA modification GTPase|nr:tRNA uridine-5-carboxymethylaminomethyl(34) synthesis GTPase MnmE [Deltaproteobacteria bacterium]
MASPDTIAAIATAPGSGGIGIIRVSGPRALPILQKIFNRPIEFAPRRLEYGWALDAAGSPLDEVLAVFMPGPRTFSGEDTAEIHCHGGAAVLEAVLGAVYALGARPAGAGEFTRRAFLNGRLDLSQAEAVAEMIAAPTLPGVHLARNKLAGRLSEKLDRLRRDLDWLRARLYLAIDFPDEAEEEDSAPRLEREFQERAGRLVASLDELLLAYERAGIWRKGALAALAGQVNVGKSSLLNALLGRRRALVSDRPGTTRDFIEESLNLGGLPLRLTDTAGLRLSDDQLETEGMELARDIFNQASVILMLLEAPKAAGILRSRAFTAADLSAEEREILDLYGPAAPPNKIFIVLHKADLAPGFQPPEVLLGCPCLAVSARAGLGLDQLAAALRQFIMRRSGSGAEPDFSDQVAPGQRQALILREMRTELTALQSEYADNIPADLLSVRLDTAAAHLADLTGHSCTEDILDQVFSKFCIGK